MMRMYNHMSWTLIFLSLTLILHQAMAIDTSCKVPAIFVFGDSLSDTGNCPRYNNPIDRVIICDRTRYLPYGKTFPNNDNTFRFSDGRLIIDFLASFFGLPFLNPYLEDDANFTNGVNYAFSGSTALDFSYLTSQLILPLTKVSIEKQLDWHLDFKHRVETTNDVFIGNPPLDSFSQGLYVIEIGGNDYIAAYNSGKTPSYVISNLIPLVIEKIQRTIETLYQTGARNFLFISITPLGCSPSILSSKTGIKDNDGCLQSYNEASYTHGIKLLAQIEKLRREYPVARFSFLDYYGAYKHILENKATFGFTNTLDACCGVGNTSPYNFNFLLFCNNRTSIVCSNPNNYLNWDGIHFTDAFNFEIFRQSIVTGTYLNPSYGLKNCTINN